MHPLGWQIVVWLGVLLVTLPVAAAVVYAILTDAHMLVAGSAWLLLLYLIVPLCVTIYAIRNR